MISIGNCMKATVSRISAASDTLHIKVRSVKGIHPQFQKLKSFFGQNTPVSGNITKKNTLHTFWRPAKTDLKFNNMKDLGILFS